MGLRYMGKALVPSVPFQPCRLQVKEKPSRPVLPAGLTGLRFSLYRVRCGSLCGTPQLAGVEALTPILALILILVGLPEYFKNRVRIRTAGGP